MRISICGSPMGGSREGLALLPSGGTGARASKLNSMLYDRDDEIPICTIIKSSPLASHSLGHVPRNRCVSGCAVASRAL